jgi:ABC-type multidrug transport system ATPase subunit
MSGIDKSWGGRAVLAGAHLALRPGRIAWLGGPNGAGKTTLLRIAAGLIAPDRGAVALDGLDPERDRVAYQRRLGCLSAGNGGLYARLTVRQNLEFWTGIAMVPRRRRAAAVTLGLDLFGLRDLAGARADRISMGQRQRVRLAMAFLHRPRLVLLDEPHTSLDDDGLALLRGAMADVVARDGSVLWCSPRAEQAALPVDDAHVIAGCRVERA